MFLASKLVCAIKFYPIPDKFRKEIQDSIFQYVNFPNKVITIGQKETWKIKKNGGCKLVNIQVKSETSKAKWLMEIATNPEFRIHLETFSILVGVQKGGNAGRDLIFMNRAFITRVMKVQDSFYKEALQSLSMFRRHKGIARPQDWDKENIFYNPLVLSRSGKTFKETNYFKNNNITKLGQLFDEKSKEARNAPYDKKLVSLANNITLAIMNMDYESIKEDTVFLGNTEVVKMANITQKQLYEDAILFRSGNHSYMEKWAGELNILVLWDVVWDSVHHFPMTNKTKTAIWEQIHLNFYTQYSYNKWNDVKEMCPLCMKEPKSIFHIILHCDFTNNVWTQLQPTLLKLSTKSLDDAEKSLGIVQIKKPPCILIRNWLGYKLREQILLFERRAYHQSRVPSVDIFKATYNQSIAKEVKDLMYRLNNEGNLRKFDEIVAYGGILCVRKGQGEYILKKVFQ